MLEKWTNWRDRMWEMWVKLYNSHYYTQHEFYLKLAFPLRALSYKGKASQPLQCAFSAEKDSWATRFSRLYSTLLRGAPAVHIKASLSWQTLEDFTLTVSLCVNQIKPGHMQAEKSQTKTKSPSRNNTLKKERW